MMTFTDLQKQVLEMTEEEQDKLVAYLTLLQKQRDPEWIAKIDERLTDKSSSRWKSLEELEKQWKTDG